MSRAGSTFQRQVYRFAERQTSDIVPPWTATTTYEEDGNNKNDEGTQLSLGMHRSLAAPLDEPTWEIDSALGRETGFFAGIYATRFGYNVGLIRIPRYVHSPEKAEFFGDLIRSFEAATDALLIDQQFNPGGSLLQMYTMCSYLTDRPLSVPLHQIKLWENDVPEAEDVLERQLYGDNLPEEDRPNSYEISWAHIVLEHAKLGKGALSDPIPLFGISQIEPADHVYTKPIFLLSNECTFSAGEFLAAILKDNRRAILLGRNTAGAGGCVRKFDLKGDGVLPMRISLTWTVGWRRNGILIENIGITPDIEIHRTREDIVNNNQHFRDILKLSIAMGLHEPKGISVLPELRDKRNQTHV